MVFYMEKMIVLGNKDAEDYFINQFNSMRVSLDTISCYSFTDPKIITK